jgi:hypothetical protein
MREQFPESFCEYTASSPKVPLEEALTLQHPFPSERLQVLASGHHGVGAGDLRIVERRLVDAALQVIGHEEAWHAAEEAEHAPMRTDPVRGRFVLA